MTARLAGVTLRNFKAVGDAPLHLRLAPVTLLYGPNGAGKSTILHALHYAREVLGGRLDVDRTQRGGALDLGGFRNILHQRDLQREMVLGFELEVEDLGSDWWDATDRMGFSIAPDSLLPADRIAEAAVELTIAWSAVLARPFVSRCAVSLLGKPFAAIAATADCASVELVDMDFDHPVFVESDADEDERTHGVDHVLLAGKDTPRIGVFGLKDALPSLREPLHLDLDGETLEQTRQWLDAGSERAAADEQRALMDWLSALIVGPLQQLRDALDDLVHIGPLRAVPPRGYRAQATPDPARWADGMAGWDRLLGMDAEQIAQVDTWLSGDDRLRSGFGVKIARSIRVPSAHPLNALIPEATALDLGDLRALWDDLPEERRVTLVDAARGIDVEPGDIGVGVSQILPVVVAALDEDLRLVAVEQPELHVHPRLQVVLGDLFAEGARPLGEQLALFDDIPALPLPSGRTFLIETHSEHLLLRLLRRIREANEGAAEADAPPVTPATISVNYLLPHADGVRLVPLRVDETGEFVDRWPDGFFAEREDELF